MPWTVKDVPRFTKKAKTAAQKKKWVSIANATLKSCQASGGTNCEATAIRVANSKFSEGNIKMTEETKVPKGALRFVDHDCHAHVEFADLGEGEKKVPKLKMVAYSGGIIKGHWYWDNLAIDLEGIQFKQSKFPVLENHSTDRKIAVIGKPQIIDGKLMAPENAKFLSTEYSEEFQRLSSEGFPYQSSIYAKPTSVERLEEDATAEVNGYKMKGPGTIWRKCEFKEMSVCVFGWDSDTKSSAFSREEQEEIDCLFEGLSAKTAGENGNNESLELETGKEVKKEMNRKELLEEHGDLVQSLIDDAVAKVQEKFEAEKKDLESKLATAATTNEDLTSRVMKLEKDEIIRRGNEQKAKADSIWTRKLAESDIPTNLHEKVAGYVSHTKFVKDDVFDVGAFEAAVDAEIADWEGRGVKASVIGSGFSEKEVETPAQVAEAAKMAENESIVKRLAAHAGVKVSD